ncbi:MAG TPA: hypothetical protein VNQ97_14775, partial [Burkholderiaceae bacterium]|nr:hypothetical protein [Burkholderiaceae bacterium]
LLHEARLGIYGVDDKELSHLTYPNIVDDGCYVCRMQPALKSRMTRMRSSAAHCSRAVLHITGILLHAPR